MPSNELRQSMASHIASTADQSNTTSSQPPEGSPDGGEQTEQTQASTTVEAGVEGAAEGAEQTQTEDQGTTAEGEEGETPEEQGKGAEAKWSEEESKWITDKGLGEIAHSEPVAKALKIARDAEKRLGELHQENTLKNDYMAAIGDALVRQDFDYLNEMAKELGGDALPFKPIKPEDQIREIVAPYNEVFDAFDAVKAQFGEAWPLVDSILAQVGSKYQRQIDSIQRKAEIAKLTEESLRKQGLEPGRGKYGSDLESKAKAEHTKWMQGEGDLETKKEVQGILTELFKAGDVFVRPSKAWAMAPKRVVEVGEAMEFKRNFEKKYLPKIKEQVKEQLKIESVTKPPPRGGSKVGGSSAPGEKSFNSYAGRTIAKRLGL